MEHPKGSTELGVDNKSERKKRVYIDMDNTLCDFSSKSEEMKALSRGTLLYPQSKYGFFTSLEPLPGALSAYRVLEAHFEVYILTAPSHLNPLCYTEKRVWVEQHLGLETTKNLIICKRKGLLKGDYLIDDHLYPEFEGEQIQIGTAPFQTWKEVLDYILKLA
ncbi:MAG: 5'-3'-deoxyribonucleotidase [uncultured Aureispira sp.]|uniref:5'-3'-deoxyribonucleotidase n=1 Tax=uncultured Aureispira sp. TaxID=1331704 RepID=A0A6S6SHI2_9BACT|nr:MAG: 5'-3'-deoxyribonucleotidase [uncultured Aureispira sp.]